MKKYSIAFTIMSGWPDSNWRPPAPKTGALANCATPRWISFKYQFFKEQNFSGEGGIRTLDTS